MRSYSMSTPRRFAVRDVPAEANLLQRVAAVLVAGLLEAFPRLLERLGGSARLLRAGSGTDGKALIGRLQKHQVRSHAAPCIVHQDHARTANTLGFVLAGEFRCLMHARFPAVQLAVSTVVQPEVLRRALVRAAL